MRPRLFLLLLFLGTFVFGTPLLAQTTSPLPNGFDSFQLGMSLADLKKALSASDYFVYRGDPDVTLLSRPNTNLIDVPGITFFTRGVFQIVDGKLYSLSLDFNPSQLDYFALYSRLTKKYGDPQSLDPSIARWQNDKIQMSLEKPLTVKYLDLPVFTRLQKEAKVQESYQKITREKFLDLF